MAPLTPVWVAMNHFVSGAIEAARLKRVEWERTLPALLEKEFNAASKLESLVGQQLLDKFTHEEDFHLRRDNSRWDLLLGPVGPRCIDEEIYGTVTDPVYMSKKQLAAKRRFRGQQGQLVDSEFKITCGLSKMPNCTVIAIGSNGQWSFEADIVSRTSCRVHTFDCTVPATVQVPPALSDRVQLHRMCIGQRPPAGRGQFLYVPKTWNSRQWKDAWLSQAAFGNYSDLMKFAGLTTAPALLKMDAEGYEWTTLQDIVSTNPTLVPQQLAVEMHFQTQMPGLPWFGRLKSPAEILALGNALARAGYAFRPACTAHCVPSLQGSVVSQTRLVRTAAGCLSFA